MTLALIFALYRSLPMKHAAGIHILCLIFIFSFPRPATTNAQEAGRVRPESTSRENRERENRERENRELKRESTEPAKSRRQPVFIPEWRAAESDFHRIDIQSRTFNSTVNV